MHRPAERAPTAAWWNLRAIDWLGLVSITTTIAAGATGWASGVEFECGRGATASPGAYLVVYLLTCLLLLKKQLIGWSILVGLSLLELLRACILDAGAREIPVTQWLFLAGVVGTWVALWPNRGAFE